MTTPEPELNVEAALDRIWGAGLDWVTSDDFKSLSDDERDAVYLTYKANVINPVLALIQQVSDQRVREFAEKIKGETFEWRGENLPAASWRAIDQTLIDYLSHKETK
jgi:hypothetical protein